MNLSPEMMDCLPVRLYLKDREGRFVYFNREAAKAFRLKDASEAVGRTDYDYFGPEHADDARRDELGVLAGGAPVVDKEESENWRDGRRTWVLTSKLPWRDDAGRVIGIVGMSKDITQSKEALERYRFAVESAGEGLWHRNLETNQMWYSARWKQILGYEDDELPNEYEEWRQRVHPDDQARVQAAVKDHLAGRTPMYECEYRMRHKDGGYRWIRVRGCVTRDESGRPRAFGGSHTDITDRKVRETLFEHILDTVPSLIFVKDQELRFTFVNRAVADAFGRDKAEVIGKTDADLIADEEQVKLFTEDDRRVLSGEEELDISEEYLTNTLGNVQRLATKKVKLKPLPESPDQRPQVLGVATNITELLQAREDLEKERELLHNLMEDVLDCIFFKDPDGKFTRVNRELARLVGAESPEAMVGKTDADFFDEDYAHKAREEELRIFASGEPEVKRIRRTMTASGPRWRMVSKFPIKRGGRVVQIVGISKDITELKAAEDLLEQILNNMPQCVWVKDADGKYIKCNRSFATRRGYADPADMIGKTDYDHWPREEADRYRRKDVEVMTRNRAETFREEQHMADGSVAVLQTSKIPLAGPAGNVTHLLGIYEDITEQLEHEHLRLHANISKALRHCLKNWMFAVEGNVSALKRAHPAVASSAPCKGLEAAVRNLRHAADLATNFTALDANRSPRMEGASVVDVLRSVVEAWNDPRIWLLPSGSPPHCPCLRHHLRNAIMELVANARDFAPPGPAGVIEAWVAVNGSACEVHVRDNGKGIPLNLKGEQLFQPFKTLEPNRTGMGLAYVREVVDKHPGAWVREVGGPGEGAHFVIALPVEPGQGGSHA